MTGPGGMEGRGVMISTRRGNVLSSHLERRSPDIQERGRIIATFRLAISRARMTNSRDFRKGGLQQMLSGACLPASSDKKSTARSQNMDRETRSSPQTSL
jgi:hypothetical protein